MDFSNSNGQLDGGVIFNAGFGEVAMEVQCMDCGLPRRAGLTIRFGDKQYLKCVYCLGGGIYRYQILSGDTFMDSDVATERGSSTIQDRVEKLLFSLLDKHGVKSSELSSLSEDIVQMLNGAKLKVPFASEFQEMTTPQVCNRCKGFHRVGIVIQPGYQGKAIADKMVFFCVKCIRAAVYRYQDEHPEDNVIQVEAYKEGPGWQKEIATAVENHLGHYDISNDEVKHLADEVLFVFDGDKWDSM